MKKGIYRIGTCDYCGEDNNILRPTPFMADRGAEMCEHCWKSTKKEYAASNGEYIDSFDSMKEDYQEVKQAIENGFEVIQISLDGNKGWVIQKENYINFKDELEDHNAEVETEYQKVRIDFVLDCIKVMKIGDQVEIGAFGFECFKMAKETFNNMEEFPGW